MEEFCGSKFWDWELTWYTESPSFTPCFEETVLVWVPCSFLFFFSILEFFTCYHSKYRDIPYGWLNSTKLFGIGILLLITFLDITYAFLWHPPNMRMYAVDYTTGIVKNLTFLLLGIILVKRRKYGVRTSAIVFFFWFLLVIFSIPQYIRQLGMAYSNREAIRLYPYISNVVYFPVILSMFLLELFIDSRPTLSLYPPMENPARQENVSFANNLLLIWYDSFAFGKYRKIINMSDLWGLPYEDTLPYLLSLFYQRWREKADVIRRKFGARKVTKKEEITLTNGYQRLKNESRSLVGKQKEISIIPILWNCFSWTYISITLLKVGVDSMMFVSPQILSLLITFEQDDEPIWRGYLYMAGLVVNGVVQTILINTYAFNMLKMGLKMRSMLMAVVFRKVLRISNGAKKIFTVGDISNLMAVDAQRFFDLNLYLNMAISAPFTISASLYFLWQLIGSSAIAGLALMLVIIVINGYAAGMIKGLQTRQMRYKDERVKITNEVLTGIKVLKMYAWESSFDRKISKIREQEIKMLKYAAYLNTAISFIWTMAPFLVSLVTFALFTMADENNVLTAEIAFVSLSLFNVMRLPISLLPRFIANVTQAYVAAKRINKFLNSEELDDKAITHDKTEAHPLIIENGSFSWDEDDSIATLQNINIKVTKGSLVAIVGRVGSGKSSLLSSFLGEMHKLNGRVNTKGSIAYVPQQAWLQNATLRDNILFMKPYKANSYNRVVDSCALFPDFQVLPASDMTEIGEKGVNLSGGQKQRISLARSVYNDADIYLLDDPLSAVDAHVGKHIFEKVIGPQGLLRNKTRLLVTNAITYLPEADYIVVMKNGTIVESGTYNELLSNQREFADYITNFSLEQDPNSEAAVDEPPRKTKEAYERTLSEDRSTFPDPISPTLDEHEPVVGEKLIEAERIEEGRIKWAVYLYYIKSGGLTLWAAAILFNVIFQVLSVAANFWLTDWSTDPQIVGNYTERVPSKRYFYLGVYTLYGIGQFIAVVLGTLFMYLGTISASTKLHKKLLEKVLRWPSYVFDITPLGRILNRFSYDVDVVDNTFPFTLRQLLTLGGTIISTLYVIAYSSPIFVVLIIPIVLIYLILEQVYVGVMRQLKRLESVSRTPVFTHFSETITGAPSIRAYNMEANFIADSERRIYKNQICTYPNLQAQRWVGLRLDNLGNLIIFLASLFAVLKRGTTNAGVISLSITYALQITGSLNWLIRTASDIETNIVSVERIKDFEKSPEEKLKSPTYKRIPRAWPNKGVIVFDKYKTRYREGLDFVLHGLDLQINSGEKVGIVGRTGAGKSSLTLSLFRIIEAAEGKIVIDGIDIAEIELRVLRSRITIIPQDPVLFSGTVRLNLDPFFEYSDQELWRSLEVAHLKDFVSSLSHGLDFVISENGGNLSIGQRQLICLARAVLRKTKILVLDEATAAIDLETDEIIQKTIRREFRDCTVLTIAHKLNTIMDSDRIVILDQGLVKEFDTPANLLQSKSSVFYGMAKEAGLVS